MRRPVPKKKNPVSEVSVNHKKSKKKGKETRITAKRDVAIYRRKTSSKEEIEERRDQVLKMRLAGTSLRDIGKKLGVGYMTIKRDMDKIRATNRRKVSTLQREHVIGKSLSVYEQVEKEAWEQYYGSLVGSKERSQFLNVIRASRGDQTKLLFDVGLLDKAPQEVKHTVHAAGVLEGWTKDAQQIVSMAIIRAQMNKADAARREYVLENSGNGRRKMIDVPANMERAIEEAKQGNLKTTTVSGISRGNGEKGRKGGN